MSTAMSWTMCRLPMATTCASCQAWEFYCKLVADREAGQSRYLVFIWPWIFIITLAAFPIIATRLANDGPSSLKSDIMGTRISRCPGIVTASEGERLKPDSEWTVIILAIHRASARDRRAIPPQRHGALFEFSWIVSAAVTLFSEYQLWPNSREANAWPSNDLLWESNSDMPVDYIGFSRVSRRSMCGNGGWL